MKIIIEDGRRTIKIVILDSHTLNPGDLSWQWIETLGDVTIYERSSPDQVSTRIGDAEIVFTNKVVINQSHIQSAPNLRYIGVMATGYNIVDIQAARARNIPVTNVPSYGTPAVAQMTFALLLELAHHVGHHAQTVREGKWTRSPDFCYWDFPLVELEGKNLGLIGFGRIGQTVARIAQAFGMNVSIPDRGKQHTVNPAVKSIPLDELFSTSDVVSLHCPLTADNKEMINQHRLNQMKPSAFLINTSRGLLIHEQDLADALNSDRIAGAALDVLSVEPPPESNPLLHAKNCIITPHIAWAAFSSRERMMKMLESNLLNFLKGNPTHVIN